MGGATMRALAGSDVAPARETARRRPLVFHAARAAGVSPSDMAEPRADARSTIEKEA
jgi:hypothetical protein